MSDCRGKERQRLRVVAAGILAASLLFCGCWDHIEINDLSIIGVLAVDGTPGDVQITAEIFRPPASTDGAGVQGFLRSVTISRGYGRSVADAARCLNRALPRLAYGAHIVAVVVGEEYARHDIKEILDLWQRTPEFRMSAFLLIAKGRASDILTSAAGELEPTVAAQIEGLRRTVPVDGRTTVATVHDIIRGITSDSRAAVTGVIALEPSEGTPVPRSPLPGEIMSPIQPAVFNQLTVTGIALLKGTKLHAVIPGSDLTKAIVANADSVQGAVLTLNVPPVETGSGDTGYNTTVEITHFEGRVRARTEQTLKIMIELRVELELTSQRHEREATAEEIQAIEEAVVEKLRTTQSEAVRLLQSLSCDVMGFAGAVHRADPKVWAGIRDDWDQVFRTIPFEVKAEAQLTHTGLTRAPAWKAPGPT